MLPSASVRTAFTGIMKRGVMPFEPIQGSGPTAQVEEFHPRPSPPQERVQPRIQSKRDGELEERCAVLLSIVHCGQHLIRVAKNWI